MCEQVSIILFIYDDDDTFDRIFLIFIFGAQWSVVQKRGSHVSPIFIDKICEINKSIDAKERSAESGERSARKTAAKNGEANRNSIWISIRRICIAVRLGSS